MKVWGVYASVILAFSALFATVSCSGNDGGRVHDVAYVSPADGGRLFLMDTGGDVQAVSSEPSEAPSWSPNQRRLGYLANPNESGGDLRYWERGGSSVKSVPGAAGNVRKFSWSPDSRKIAYQIDLSDGDVSEIRIYDINGDNASLVASEKGGRLELGNWSPDNDWIAIRLETDSSSGIYMRSVLGVDEIRLTKGDDWSPRFSPDGRKMAFARVEADGSTDIYTLIVDDDGGGPSEPVNLSRQPGDEIDFEWSPDGQHIVYSSTRDGNSELYAVSVNDGDTMRLTQNRVDDNGPRWSRDGDHLLFTSDADGDLDLFSMEFASRAQVRILATDNDEADADW